MGSEAALREAGLGLLDEAQDRQFGDLRNPWRTLGLLPQENGHDLCSRTRGAATEELPLPGPSTLAQSVSLGHFWKPACGSEPRSDFDRGLDNLARRPASFPPAARPLSLGHWGGPETPHLGCSQDPESGASSRPRARSPARSSRGHWACAARQALAASGRAAPDFTGSGKQGGLAWREAGAVLALRALLFSRARKATLRLKRDREGALQVRVFLPSASHLVWVRGSSGRAVASRAVPRPPTIQPSLD
ncbi:Hypothetical predicted protein [Marmota monax]|uniref:Uncharacterized protein n=1 Tax=Marmota monax TaxID=9995 RepID=A0A5E4BA34_MARMO|nr:Hypothetical predicted protein [Marmota monax]